MLFIDSHSIFDGARREGRTPTLVKEPDFESGASASSAIRAMMSYHGFYLIKGFLPRTL